MDSSDIIAYLADKDTLGRGLLGDEVVANHLVDQITNNLGAVDSEHDSYAVLYIKHKSYLRHQPK